MARYKDEQCRICRKRRTKIILKRFKDATQINAVFLEEEIIHQVKIVKRKRKLSEYGTQLREKQKTKSFL